MKDPILIGFDVLERRKVGFEDLGKYSMIPFIGPVDGIAALTISCGMSMLELLAACEGLDTWIMSALGLTYQRQSVQGLPRPQRDRLLMKDSRNACWYT